MYARRRSALPTPATASSSSPLLKTPTAQLAINGGSQHPDKRKRGGHGPTLADEVEHLLPTPAARDFRSGKSNIMDRNARPLNEVVVNLLPTPTATPYGNNQSPSPGAAVRPSLDSLAPTLLPTPRAAAARTSRMAIKEHSSSPSLEQAIELAAGQVPRELASLNDAPKSWRGASSSTPSADGSTPSDGPPLGQLTLAID